MIIIEKKTIIDHVNYKKQKEKNKKIFKIILQNHSATSSKITKIIELIPRKNLKKTMRLVKK